MREILLNVFQVIALLYGIYVISAKSKKKMLRTNFINSAINLSVYIAFGELSSLSAQALITLRNFAYVFRSKYKTNVICYLFLCIQVITAIVTFNSVWGLLPHLAASIAIVTCWFCDTKRVRTILITSDLAWITYNIHEGLYIESLTFIIYLLSRICFLIKYRNITETS